LSGDGAAELGQVNTDPHLSLQLDTTLVSPLRRPGDGEAAENEI
jgi:hypothetical protein